MKLRVIFNTGDQRVPVNLLVLEAIGYSIDHRTGALTIFRQRGEAHEPIVIYAAGVWRSCADVGALSESTAAASPPTDGKSENPRRRQQTRQAAAP